MDSAQRVLYGEKVHLGSRHRLSGCKHVACSSRLSILLRKSRISRRTNLKRAAKAALILGNLFVYIRHPRQIRTFHRLLGYWPNVCCPRTKNEKFLWRKIFDRNPMYRLVADKLMVRQFIKMRCPDLAMSDIVWIGASPEQIPDALLEPGVVIKTNNGSGRNIFVNAAQVNRAQINQQVTEWLTQPYGIPEGEWNYRDIRPYVLIERLVCAPGDPQFVDISCHVLMGKVRAHHGRKGCEAKE